MTIERAAGVVCWRRASSRESPESPESHGHGLEVLLVHRPRYDDWSWPKGKVKGLEPTPLTAIREAAEETGLDVVLGRPLGDVRYRLPAGGRKHVGFWAATPVGHAGEARVAPEVDALAWLPLPEARARLTRESDAGPLDVLERFAAQDALATTPVLVVRHGTSRPRRSWAGPDADRPLVSDGRRQARGLVPLLACWRPERLVSSPWKRCMDTIEPYATAAGLPIRMRGSLSEDGARRSPGRVRRSIRRLLDRDRPALLCTHRPVLGEVFDVVRAACTPEAAEVVPGRNPYLAPGEVLVAHVIPGAGRGRVVAVERHLPQS